MMMPPAVRMVLCWTGGREVAGFDLFQSTTMDSR